MFRPPGECPVCGEEVHAGARACPECGADERSGWRGLDFAEKEAFEYDAYLAREFGQEPPRPAIGWGWWLTAVIVLLALLLPFMRG